MNSTPARMSCRQRLRGSNRAQSRIGQNTTSENQNRSAVEGRDQRRHLAAEPHAHLEPHQALADGRRVLAADGDRVIAEADGGKDQAEQQPGEAERETPSSATTT